jgi:hypothetical protein
MKQFTVKDFIAYNNPCFSCQRAISFRICVAIKPDGTAVSLRPTVSLDQTEIDLKTTYLDTLKLWIFHTTNKIISSNFSELTEYLNNNTIFLMSTCDNCGTGIQSEVLTFNLDKGYIKPVTINSEGLIIYDDKSLYEIFSDFENKKTSVLINVLDKTHPISPVRFELPLLPLYKFKTRERILEKLKTYLTFS